VIECVPETHDLIGTRGANYDCGGFDDGSGHLAILVLGATYDIRTAFQTFT